MKFFASTTLLIASAAAQNIDLSNATPECFAQLDSCADGIEKPKFTVPNEPKCELVSTVLEGTILSTCAADSDVRAQCTEITDEVLEKYLIAIYDIFNSLDCTVDGIEGCECENVEKYLAKVVAAPTPSPTLTPTPSPTLTPTPSPTRTPTTVPTSSGASSIQVTVGAALVGLGVALN